MQADQAQPSDPLDRLARAFQIAEAWRRTDGRAESIEDVLARHLDLRSLLEPMLRCEPDADPTARVTEPATRRIHRFEIRAELGHGGMGVVYRAFDPVLRRDVALKVMSGTLLGARERFTREATVAARFDHPNLCAVFDSGEDGDDVWLAMPLVPGETLEARLRALAHARGPSGPNPGHVAWATELVETLARALHHAHQLRLVHRDVKPSNVMVRPDGVPVILDFGVARDIQAEVQLTASGVLMGTAAYMSPEQAAGNVVERDADIWALGVLLYECLTLEQPFSGPTRAAVLEAIRTQPTPRLRHRWPAIPRDLELVVQVALQKAPSDRYATALDLAEDLRRVRAHETILARRPGVARRLRRWVERQPLVAALLVALTAGLAFAGWSLWRAEWYSGRSTKLQDEVARLADTQRSLQRDIALQEAQREFRQGLDHASRGAWDAALRLYDRVERTYPDPIELELARVEALEGAFRVEEARTRVQALLGRTDLRAHEPRVLLFAGDRTREWAFKFAPEIADELQRAAARKSELPAADAAYLTALLATDVSDAIAALDQALAQDSRHRRANEMIVPTLLMVGQLEEASARAREFVRLFADDPSALVMERLCARLRGDTPPDLPGGMSACAEDAMAGVDAFFAGWTATSDMGYAFARNVVDQKLHGKVDLMAALSSFVRKFQASGSEGATEALYRLPPSVLDTWNKGVRDGMFAILGTAPAKQARASLTKLIERNPDGIFWFYRGLACNGMGDLSAAAADFHVAAQRPSFLRGYRKASLFAAIALDARLAEPDPSRAFDCILRALDPGSQDVLRPSADDFRFLSRCAHERNLHDLASLARRRWADTLPGSEVEIAEDVLLRGDKDAARGWVEAALRRDPEDARARDVHARCSVSESTTTPRHSGR